MHYRSTRRHTFLALLGAAGLVAGSGVAAAQVGPMALPGTNDDEVQIAVGHEDLATVTVDEVDESSVEVTGSVENTSDAALTCGAPGAIGQSDAVTVTYAGLVDRSLNYLTGNLVAGGGGLGIPGLNPGSMDVMLGTGSLGSLGLGDPAAVELDAIQQAQNQARLAGHYGTATGFTVAAGESHDWTATLSVPSGDRTDFEAAALVTCEQDGQWYAFAGYEDVEDDNDNGGGGSLDMGSLGMGSLGS